MKASRKTGPAWHVTLRDYATGKTRLQAMPGGLSEAEALRCASLKCGGRWRAISAELIPAGVAR